MKKALKVLFVDTTHPRLPEMLNNAGFEVDYNPEKVAPDNINEIIPFFDGIIIRSKVKIGKEIIDKAKNLKFIARVGAGLESIDITYANKHHIALIAAPEGNRNAVGEHALGMLLALFNRLKKADLEIRSGKWLREENRGIELEGKTIGIIGYGNMGKAFAKKLKGFDCEVLCYDIKENVGDENAKQVSLQELFTKTEVLSLHTPQTELTEKMINKAFILQFKKSFYLINTARGSAVVTNDLVEALENGKILGACLDVLEYEKASFENFFSLGNELPPAFQYLISSDKVLLSPHVAGWTIESKFKLADTIVQKVIELHKKVI